jgi:ATP-dependent Zn protease
MTEQTNDTTNDRMRRSTAIHEAGHAVAAWTLQRKFRSVTVRADAESDGHVRHNPWPDWSQPDIELSTQTTLLLQDRIVISFAGPAAERRIARRTRAAVNISGQGDRNMAADLGLHLSGSTREWEALLRWLQARAENLVVSHRHEIKMLANELLQRETLSWRAVRGLLNPTTSAITFQD